MTNLLILDQEQLKRALIRIAHEILEKNQGASNIAIVGIQSRGFYLAQRLVKNVSSIESIEVPIGALDISLYRDDLSTNPQPILKKTEVNFDLMDKNIILVDDVLYTGRTIRAALDALTDIGRPASIQLAVLVDRGHRQLPIRPDYVGKNIPTATRQRVSVQLAEESGQDIVTLEAKADV